MKIANYYIVEYPESFLPSDVLKRIEELKKNHFKLFKYKGSWFFLCKEIVEGNSEKDIYLKAEFTYPFFGWQGLTVRIWTEIIDDDDDDDDESGGVYKDYDEEDFSKVDFKLIKIGERYFGFDM